jgi:MFS family permease
LAEARAPRIDFWALTGGKTLLQQRRVRRLLLERILSQVGQNALLYALLVLVVKNTGSSIKTGAFLLAFLVPSAVLGPASGVIVDRLSRGWLLVVVNGLRVILCLGLIASAQSTWELYLFALGLSASIQFAGPAESAALPQVVEPEELTGANSLFNLGGLGGQAIGLAVLAPLFMKTVGADPLFVVIGVLFAASAVVVATIPGLTAPHTPAELQEALTPGIRVSFAKAWQMLRRDRQTYLASIMLVVGSAALLVGVTVLPSYAREMLDVSPENVIFIFSPAVIGIFLGLRLVNWLVRVVGAGRAVTLGFALLALSLLAFGLVSNLGDLLAHVNPLGVSHPGPLNGRGARVAVTMVTAVFAGFSYSLINVASRALVNTRMPMEMQGRVFAALNVLTNLASVVPLVVAGALADWIGVRPVLVADAVGMTLFIIWIAARPAPPPPVMGGSSG